MDLSHCSVLFMMPCLSWGSSELQSWRLKFLVTCWRIWRRGGWSLGKFWWKESVSLVGLLEYGGIFWAPSHHSLGAVVYLKHFAAVLSLVKFSDPTNLWKIEGGGRDRWPTVLWQHIEEEWCVVMQSQLLKRNDLYKFSWFWLIPLMQAEQDWNEGTNLPCSSN